MAVEAGRGETAVRQNSCAARILAVSVHILVGVLALVGAVAIAEAPFFTAKTEPLLNADWPKILERADHYVKYGAIALAAVTALLAVRKLDTIVRAFSGYREARAPIYELADLLAGIKAMLELLKDTMSSVQQTSVELSQQATKIKELRAAIEKTDRAVKDAVDQLADMERMTAVGAVESTPVMGDEDEGSQDPASEAWEELRTLWNTNARRLDSVRSSIDDGRTRARFMRMHRRNYKKIIDALADEKYISETARNSSLRLHQVFMAARRSKAVLPQVIGDIRNLDQSLEHEFETYERPTNAAKPLVSPTPVDNNANALA